MCIGAVVPTFHVEIYFLSKLLIPQAQVEFEEFPRTETYEFPQLIVVPPAMQG
jgi:hypothetical protein